MTGDVMSNYVLVPMIKNRKQWPGGKVKGYRNSVCTSWLMDYHFCEFLLSMAGRFCVN